MKVLLVFTLFFIIGCSNKTIDKETNNNEESGIEKDSEKLKEEEISLTAPYCDNIEGLMIASKKDSITPLMIPMLELIPEDYTGIVKGCKDDKISWYAEYENGKKNGLHVVYFGTGDISFMGHYKNGERHGTSYSYRENGILASKNNYKNGQKHGIQKAYNSSGALQGSEKYNNGELDFQSIKGNMNPYDGEND